VLCAVSATGCQRLLHYIIPLNIWVTLSIRGCRQNFCLQYSTNYGLHYHTLLLVCVHSNCKPQKWADHSRDRAASSLTRNSSSQDSSAFPEKRSRTCHPISATSWWGTIFCGNFLSLWTGAIYPHWHCHAIASAVWLFICQNLGIYLSRDARTWSAGKHTEPIFAKLVN